MQIKKSYDVVPADELPEITGRYNVILGDTAIGAFYYHAEVKTWASYDFTHWLRPRTYYVVDGVLYESEQQAREKIGANWDAGH